MQIDTDPLILQGNLYLVSIEKHRRQIPLLQQLQRISMKLNIKKDIPLAGNRLLCISVK